MEKKLNDIALSISESDSEILDKAFEDFEKGAEITEEEQERILSSVMRKAGYNNMSNNISNKEGSKKMVKVIFRRVAAVLAAAVLATGTVSMLVSADVANTYDIVYSVAPSIAQTMKPLNVSCENEGIEMNVVSASIVDNEVYVYVAIKDNQGDRIDSTVDLFDSYFIRTPFPLDFMGGCSFDRYDEETKTAYFFIHISSMDGKSIQKFQNKKITFSLNTLLTGKQTTEGEITEIDLSSVTEKDSRAMGDLVWGYGGLREVTHEEMITSKFLIPESEPICEPANHTAITAIGYVDGKLHVQAFYEDMGVYDNRGLISLIDKDGNKIEGEDWSFSDENNDLNTYIESVFDIPMDKISDYKLYGEFITCDTRIDGGWEVTFKVD